MSQAPKVNPPKNPLLNSFRIDSRTYEQQYTDCGKPNCSRCRTPHGRKGSHGPYWYLCAYKNGKWYRIYIGKNCDTAKHMLPSGEIDWKKVLSPHAYAALVKKAPEPPLSAPPGDDGSHGLDQARGKLRSTVDRLEALPESSVVPPVSARRKSDAWDP